MAKVKFVCNNCGYESGKWYGKCPECSNWNTVEEIEVQEKKSSFNRQASNVEVKIEKASTIKTSLKARLSTGFEEFDRVLGSGIVPGSVILLSGDPGIGKSTLLLQVALNIARRGASSPSTLSSNVPCSVFYITGEESSDQVKIRMERIVDFKEIESSELFIISATNIEKILQLLEDKEPSLIIVDSIQTMESGEFPGFPGSIPQIRNATSQIISYAKRNQVPAFLVGHVTKDGIVAGPMLLSHMVDAVMYLEGEKLTGVRILRAFKNRFGDASEVGIFIMQEKGLVEIKDAANFFIDKRSSVVPGSCVTVIMEGSRPMLVEIQALVVPSSLSFPRRISTGLSEKRLELLLAVLQKHARIPVERMDVFVNVVGGLKILETSSDLAVCLAIASSFKNKSLPKLAAVSEVGLLGELRNVVNLDKRISEARKFGFKNIFTFKDNKFLDEVIKNIV